MLAQPIIPMRTVYGDASSSERAAMEASRAAMEAERVAISVQATQTDVV